MSDTLLNISGQISPDAVRVYKDVSEECEELNIPFVVVGATARDIVLHHVHGTQIERATRDIDFGIQVPNWHAFQSLKDNLVSRGYKPARSEHRLISQNHVPIDIVPFGQVEDEQANIAWPPDGDWVMNVLGFREACEHSEMVCLQESPNITIPVATPPGMTILKIIAWTDRTSNVRTKDASDLRYLLRNYQFIPLVRDRAFESEALMDRYDWNIEHACAHKLGALAAKLAKTPTYEAIQSLLTNSHTKLSVDALVHEMGTRQIDLFEQNKNLVDAFTAGFIDSVNV